MASKNPFLAYGLTVHSLILTYCLFSWACLTSGSNLRLASYYTDHMVLQREPNSAVIWGYVDQTQVITVKVKGKSYPAIPEKVSYSVSLVWRVVLDPSPPSGSLNITVSAADSGETITLKDVLYGDVWVCSGQSNMAFNVPYVFNASEVLKDASNHPDIRLLAVNETESVSPLHDLKSLYIQWSRPSPETLGVDPSDYFLYFSAVCYLFGVEMSKHLGQVPIGLISSNWGGTPIQEWSAPEVIDSCPSYKFSEEFTSKAKARGPQNNSTLWNAMIHPLLNFTIKGALWYQGEANTGEPAYHYACLFPNMIQSWRKQWFQGTGGNTDEAFAFGFVQLCTSNVPFNDTNFAPLRWAQTADYGYVPNPSMKNVFMAVSIDLPDPTSPFHAIHPRYKQDVAYRLSLGARGVAYHEKDTQYQGPFPDKVCSLNSGAIRVDYAFSNITIVSDDVFEVCCLDVIKCRSDETVWARASNITQVGPASLTVTHKCPGVPTLLRYIWQDMPCQFKKCAVYSQGSNLPGPLFMLPVEASCT